MAVWPTLLLKMECEVVGSTPPPLGPNPNPNPNPNPAFFQACAPNGPVESEDVALANCVQEYLKIGLVSVQVNSEGRELNCTRMVTIPEHETCPQVQHPNPQP